MKPCNPIARAWHRRKRQIDQDNVIASMLRHSGATKIKADVWRIFLMFPEKEHWRCPCAPKEPDFVERADE